MAARMPLMGAGLLFVAFAVNVVIGKIAILRGATTIPGLGDVGEFLVLFAAVVLFIVACLSYERADRRDARTNNADDSETTS